MPRFLERDECEREAPCEQYPWDGVRNVRPFSRFQKAWSRACTRSERETVNWSRWNQHAAYSHSSLGQFRTAASIKS